MNKALFLDRDGIINYDENGYTHNIEEFRFKEEIFNISRYFYNKGYIIIVVTNQSGIARGFYSEEDFINLSKWMMNEFKIRKVEIKDIFYCPYHKDGIGVYRKDSFDRKPNPGMLIKAMNKYNISPEESIMIGDKESDIIAAKRSKIATRILISEEICMCDYTKKYSNLKEYERALL
ncbi:hypothetical protein HMPREF9628_01526 [Peptoanaerobacter stomatis]|uniref:D,D-heptose 1,7-bisphosphate phosphatase n=1 Tax=Peptoanaerobacter stomatis TaxID=796937 RepID=G9XCE9_9FIRM|nr:HAD family hydrolase [Peptoanaerobacter stomatis]EHL19342.1 hypothetical protein HMPREF9628_01526 [Peptoanaerobacter stomatis]